MNPKMNVKIFTCNLVVFIFFDFNIVNFKSVKFPVPHLVKKRENITKTASLELVYHILPAYKNDVGFFLTGDLVDIRLTGKVSVKHFFFYS